MDHEKNKSGFIKLAVTDYLNTTIQDPRHSRLFAIVWIAGTQYKITTEDVIMIRNTFYPTVGDKIRLEKVLLVGGKDFTIVGKPMVSKQLVRVDATVIEKTISNDIIRFTYRPRKSNKHWAYEKLQQTLLRINNIEIIGPIQQSTIN